MTFPEVRLRRLQRSRDDTPDDNPTNDDTSKDDTSEVDMSADDTSRDPNRGIIGEDDRFAGHD